MEEPEAEDTKITILAAIRADEKDVVEEELEQSFSMGSADGSAATAGTNHGRRKGKHSLVPGGLAQHESIHDRGDWEVMRTRWMPSLFKSD